GRRWDCAAGSRSIALTQTPCWTPRSSGQRPLPLRARPPRVAPRWPATTCHLPDLFAPRVITLHPHSGSTYLRTQPRSSYSETPQGNLRAAQTPACKPPCSPPTAPPSLVLK